MSEAGGKRFRALVKAPGIEPGKFYWGGFIYVGDSGKRFSMPPSRWRIRVINESGDWASYNPDAFEEALGE